MFDVIQYWNAIAAKANDTRKWSELGLINQQLVINSINQLIQVLGSK